MSRPTDADLADVAAVAVPADEVRQAAAVLVSAFGRNDLEEYLACFREDATFLFHGTDRLLASREEYRREWAGWVRDDDFRVLGCRTSGTHVQVLGGTAVLTHAVHTTVSTRAGREELRERETIVFSRGASGRWLAVHEHLSPAPGVAGAGAAGAGAAGPGSGGPGSGG